jgi:quinol monooxygenase YgiN
MIIATLRIEVPPERRDEVLKTLWSFVGPTRVQTGCLSCQIYHESGNPNALTIVEEWETQEDLDRHICSDEYRKILAVMDLSSTPPGIKFSRVTEIKGMEVIETAREPH